MTKCQCGRPVEWAGELCQECWEDYSASQFWNLIRDIARDAEAENA